MTYDAPIVRVGEYLTYVDLGEIELWFKDSTMVAFTDSNGTCIVHEGNYIEHRNKATLSAADFQRKWDEEGLSWRFSGMSLWKYKQALSREPQE